MKYVYGLCMVALLTIAFAILHRPTPEAVAQTKPSEAAQQPEIVKPVNNAAPAQNAVVAAETKSSEIKPAAPPPRVLTERQQLMQQAGVPEADWAAAENIINRESGWCHTKWEGEIGYCPAPHGAPTSGGFGLCQSTPPQKMAAAGADWETNPVTQLKWCQSYVQAYGGWQPAKDFRDCLGSCYSPRTKNIQNKKTTWF